MKFTGYPLLLVSRKLTYLPDNFSFILIKIANDFSLYCTSQTPVLNFRVYSYKPGSGHDREITLNFTSIFIYFVACKN